MGLGGAAAHGSADDAPALVRRAVGLARVLAEGSACEPEQGPLLAEAGRSARYALGVTGAGCGVGLAWLLSGLRPDVRVLAVEPDRERAALLAQLLGGVGQVCVRVGSLDTLAARAPYDLLVLDADGSDPVPDPLDLGGLLLPDGSACTPGPGFAELTVLTPPSPVGLPHPRRSDTSVMS